MKVFDALVLIWKSTSRDTDLLMVVDSLGAIIADGVGVGQWRAQKCDRLSSWKRILEENRDEDEAKKHLAARRAFQHKSPELPTLAILWIPAVAKSGWKSFLAQS